MTFRLAETNTTPSRRHQARAFRRAQLLYEFVATLAMGPTRVRCELVDHGPNGFEARICYDDQHQMSHVFAPWHCIPFVTPRAGLSRPLLKFSGGSGGLD